MNEQKFSIGPYNLHIIKTEQFKRDRISIDFRTPTKKSEITYRNLLAYCLVRTTKNYPTERLMNIRKEELYDVDFSSSMTLSGNNMILSFDMTLLNDAYSQTGNFKECFLFLMEMLFNPNVEKKAFEENTFLQAKKELANNIERAMESPDFLATKRLFEEMDKKAYYSYVADGDLETLEKITPTKLYQYYLELLKKDTVDVYIVGNVDGNRVKKLVTEYFQIKTIKKSIGSHFFEHAKFRKRVKKVVEKYPSTQSQLRIGFKIENLTDFEKKYVANLYNYILGGGPDSLLFKVVREKNSLCYSISSSISKFFNIMTIRAGIEASSFKKAVRLIKKQVKKMEKGEFSEEDIEKAKTVYITSVLSIMDSPVSIVGLYEAKEYFNWDLIDQRITEIKKGTKEQIVSFAKKIHIDTIYLLEGDEHE